MRTPFIVSLFTFSAQSYAAIIVASFSVSNYSVGDRPPAIRQTSSIDQTFNLTITSPYANTGDDGFLVFQTLMLAWNNANYAPSERVGGSAYLQINDLPSIWALDYAPSQTCSNYWETKCSVPFTFGQAFTVRVRATAEIDYDYRGILPQQFHSASSSITLTPLVLLSSGFTNPGQIGANIDSGNSPFFTQSPTYSNVTVEDVAPTHNPEPGSIGLVGIGAIALAASWKRKARQILKPGGLRV